MADQPPVIMIGMDATEVTVIDRMCDAGQLPNLQRMRDRGCYGHLRNSPPGFLSMVWPTFTTGTRVTRHGWYFNKLWRHEHQRLEYAHSSWLPVTYFWNHLDPHRHRIALLDVPFTVEPPADLNGVYLNGWQNHDDFGQHESPAGLWRQLKQRFGRPVLKPEIFGPQTPATLLYQRQEALDAIDQFTRISKHLIERERWDLLLTVFGGAHRATHYLWNLREIDADQLTPDQRRLLENAVTEIYQACDRALGELLDAAPDDARVVAFSLHGMTAHTGWVEYFDRIVGQIQNDGQPAKPKGGLIYRVKKALPWTLVRQVTRRMPSSFNHAVVPIWSSRMCDWTNTKYFVLPMDINGYIRINLKGREPQGVVEPGAEYERLCAHLKEALMSFRDIESGRQVIEHVDRVEDLIEGESPARDRLPDLIIRWAEDVDAYESTGVRSERYGQVRWPRHAKRPSGRSGNHVPNGWFAATGPGIVPGRCASDPETIDLGPTVMRWLGADVPEHFEGEPISELVADAAAPAGAR